MLLRGDPSLTAVSIHLNEGEISDTSEASIIALPAETLSVKSNPGPSSFATSQPQVPFPESMWWFPKHTSNLNSHQFPGSSRGCLPASAASFLSIMSMTVTHRPSPPYRQKRLVYSSSGLLHLLFFPSHFPSLLLVRLPSTLIPENPASKPASGGNSAHQLDLHSPLQFSSGFS